MTKEVVVYDNDSSVLMDGYNGLYLSSITHSSTVFTFSSSVKDCWLTDGVFSNVESCSTA